MSIVVKVLSGDVLSSQINGRNGSFESRSQEAWIDLSSGERRKLRIRLDRGQSAWAPGDYTLHPDSFTVGQYGDLMLQNALKLVKAVASAPGTARVAG